MQGALDGKPVLAFQNVVPLEKVALTKNVKVDTPDTAPTEAGEGPTTLEANPGNSPSVPENLPPGEAPAKAIPPAAESSRGAKSSQLAQRVRWRGLPACGFWSLQALTPTVWKPAPLVPNWTPQ